MLSIQTSRIEKKDNLSVYNLNYPIIKSEIKKDIISHINKRILEDIVSFKSAVEDVISTLSSKSNHLSCVNTDYVITYNYNNIISIPIEFSQLDGLYNISYINSYNYDINLENLSCVNTDYVITYNYNNIISIPIEFSQLDGLYNISYINSYNYDINLEKEIKIDDLFNPEIDYTEIITKKIETKIKELSKELSVDKYIEVLDYLKDIILCDNPTFYISEDCVVICFSSYELDPTIPDISTFKISFKEDKEYLSKYILDRVLDR